MNILEERRTAEQRYRRQRNLLVIRTFLYLTSIVPAILVATNFEAFRQGAIHILQGGQEAPLVQQPVAAPHPQSAPIAAEPKPRERGIQQPSVQPPANPPTSRLSPSKPERLSERPLRVAAIADRVTKPAPAAVYVVALDVSRKRQSRPVQLQSADSKLQILPLDGVRVASDVVPSDGEFDAHHPAKISFQTAYQAWIEVSVDTSVRREDGSATIYLDFLVETNTGRPWPFTTKNLNKERKRTCAEGAQAQAVLANLEASKRELEAWFSAPVWKLYPEAKRRQSRLAEVSAAIPRQKEYVSALEANLKAVDELLELALSLDGARLRIVELDAQQ